MHTSDYSYGEGNTNNIKPEYNQQIDKPRAPNATVAPQLVSEELLIYIRAK